MRRFPLASLAQMAGGRYHGEDLVEEFYPLNTRNDAKNVGTYKCTIMSIFAFFDVFSGPFLSLSALAILASFAVGLLNL